LTTERIGSIPEASRNFVALFFVAFAPGIFPGTEQSGIGAKIFGHIGK
jgi:hypothetical protein